MIEENEALRADDLQPYKACTIHLFGQTALLEAGLGIPLAATQDIDVYADYEYSVRKKFERLLKRRVLLTDYLALGATERFVELVEKYNVDLERFL